MEKNIKDEKVDKKTMQQNYFEILNNVNVSDKIEKKNGLSYLSWAYAWGELKKIFPNSNYKIYETESGRNYFDDNKTAWVKTSVIVNDIEHIEYLPIMDFRNKSILIENITSFDVNKAIQRGLTKAVARHGLGLYIYAGEDLPETKKAEDKEEKNSINKEVSNELLISPIQIEILNKKYNGENLNKLLKVNNINRINELTLKKASELIKKINEKEGKKNE